MEDKQIIEVNGIKMEVDMRHATRVDTFRVGSKVNVLIKESYGDPSIKPGVVVGFEPFETLPTIIVAYLNITYNEAKLEFAYINAKNEKHEIVHTIDDFIPIKKADVLEYFNIEKQKLQESKNELERKENYFLKHFNKYFPETETVS